VPEQVEAMRAVFCASVINLAALLFPMSSTTGNGHTQGPRICVFEQLVGHGSVIPGNERGDLMTAVFLAVTGHNFGDAISDKLRRQCKRAHALFKCNPTNVVREIIEIAQRNGNGDGLFVSESFVRADSFVEMSEVDDGGPGSFCLFYQCKCSSCPLVLFCRSYQDTAKRKIPAKSWFEKQIHIF
jgi:hypothetical protein